MVTIGVAGLPKAVRVGVAPLDVKLWSSATQDRVRTNPLRCHPRCTLFVFDQTFSWLTLETVTILDGADAPEKSLRLFASTLRRDLRNQTGSSATKTSSGLGAEGFRRW